MKNIEIKTRWLVIFWIIFFALIIVGKASVWYYANHFVSIEVWHQRLKGGNVFHLRGLKIETPDNCALQTSETAPEMWTITPELTWFLCAATPSSSESVYLKRSMPDATGLDKLKNISEKFTESDEYIYIIIGPKIGLSTTSQYYLKRQNITIVSHSQELAKKFTDLLLEYDLNP